MSFTNYELRITNPKTHLRVFVFLCAFCSFTGNAFAQDYVVNKAQTDWIVREDYFKQTIRLGNVEQKRDALFQIRNLETAAASRLAIPALVDKSEIVRATAAFSVIFLPQDEATNVLLPLLKDKKELVRREAAYALGKVGNPHAIPFLLQILQLDKVLDVRAASAIALGEIGDVSAIEALTKILQNKLKTEEEFVRRSAARSVGQIAQITQTNKRTVQTPESFLPDKYIFVSKSKYPNLIEVFPTFRMANDVLIQTLQNPKETDDVKREAAFALGTIGDASAIPILQTNSGAKDYYLARICVEALNKILINGKR